MRQILLFGAGQSSAALIRYLLHHATTENWELTVADANLAAAREKVKDSPHGKAIEADILASESLHTIIKSADIVLSLLPPALHTLVAKQCLALKKNLLTASYIDEGMLHLKKEIENAGLLFLCEMGLDPGIDHMSAKQLIDDIQESGGKIQSFMSHCGGLVAPENDDNPWHYKISWNPRNVVMAGKSGALYKQQGEIIEVDYATIFEAKRFVMVPDFDVLCWYPNRDSLSYISKYGLEEAATFVRTTLRHPDFMYGWKNIIELHLTDESRLYETNNKTLLQFFNEHLEKEGFNEWLENKLNEQFDATKLILNELVNLVQLEEEAAEKGLTPADNFMMVDDEGDLQDINIDRLKITAAATLADKMHDANLTVKQLVFLGMDDDKTFINLGRCSAAEILQFALQKKLMLEPSDKDLVAMLHEIEYEKMGIRYKTTSTLLQKGEDNVYTAMSKTVGLPLAIATKLILNGVITLKGLQIPTSADVYEPVLQELKKEGIFFQEDTVRIS